VNRVLLLGFLGLPLAAYWRIAQNPCCINEIDIGGGNVCIHGINATQHLDAIAIEQDPR
jgi:probable phosphoglycerate mutase